MSRPVLLAAALLFGGAMCIPQQGLKSGPYTGDFRYNATANLDRFGHFNTSANGTAANQMDVGVCYTEVLTASIAKDPHHIPAGNGSTPSMSRIRTCCAGYARSTHNYRRCEPICSQGCVNGFCIAPETCSCLQNHIKNLAGFCVPTCPVSCQNGHCSGGECLCLQGYKLDSESKFCVPACRDNCGGHGNCTAPDTCLCPREFPRGADGSCRASCTNCAHGDCVGPNQCVCHKGYNKNNFGECVPVCSRGCTNGVCVAPDVCTCEYGFHHDEAAGICQPKCLVPCVNALCTAPDTCTCKPGYTKEADRPLSNLCVPSCPGGCPNGVCTAPNYCICNFGFVKDRGLKGSQACVKAPMRTARAINTALDKLLSFNIPEQM